MTTNRTAALKIGVLLDGMDVPSWAYHMLQSVLDGEYASIEVLIIDERQIASGDAHHARLLSPLKILSQRWFDYFIERPNNGADACAPKSVAELLSTTPQCRIQTDNTTPRTHLPTPVIDQLNGLQLDVLVNINSRTLDGAVLGVSKHGVWSLLNRDNSQPRSGPPCFWETMQSWPVLSSGVSVVNRENPHGLLIYRSFAPVDRFSITTNINNLYWKSQAFIPRLLERLYQQGDAFYDTLHIDTVQPATEPLEFEQLKIEHRRSPRAGQGAGQRTPQQLLHQAEVSPTQHSTLVVKKTLEKLRWVFHNKRNVRQWALMVHAGDDPFTPAWQYRAILPPKDRFWADPFVVHRDDRHYIFIEELLYESNKGHIAVIEINDSGEPSTPQTVLECDYHLSYPFVFDHDGETWMIPESSENQTVSLYRCRKFPDQWEFVMHLFEGQSLVDCTLHFHDGLWWLFANTAAHSSLAKHDELHLFYATDFRSTGWTAHPLNPIVSDAKNARPAGKLFYHQGRLVRPAQNCSYHYGYGYNLNVIHTLNTTQYAESNLRAVIPNWDRSVVATHTYNASPGLSVIDAMVVRPR